MKAVVMFILFAALAVNAQVGAYNIAKEQARRASASNAAEQQRLANAERDPATPNAPAQPAPDPVREATMKNISDLQADFTALSKDTGAEIPAAQKTALLNDLTTAASGKKPETAAVQKLADHLIVATSGKKNAAQQVLARNVHALFNGSHLTAAQTTSLLDGVKKNLAAAGAAETDAASVVDDLKSIADATK